MQLIETETSVDKKDKMSAVEDQVIEKFELNKPREISNGHTESSGNSDDDLSKETNEVTATQSIENIITFKENSILGKESSQLDTNSKSNSTVDHTPNTEGDQPITVSNDKQNTNPELNDKCNDDINKDSSNIVSSISNDSSEDFSLVFDSEGSTPEKNENILAVTNEEVCKDKEITGNKDNKTVDTLESDRMETGNPVECATDKIADINDDNDTNLDKKDPLVSEVTDLAESKEEPMEIDNDKATTESHAMEVQSEVIETTMDPVTENKVLQVIAECEANKKAEVEATVSEKVVAIEDLVSNSDTIADKVEPTSIVKSNSASSDTEKTTDECNKLIESHDTDMLEATPMGLNKPEEPIGATKTIDNIESKKITVNESIENVMETEKPSDNNPEKTKASSVNILKENKQPTCITTETTANKTIDDEVNKNSDIATVDNSESKTENTTATNILEISEGKPAEEIEEFLENNTAISAEDFLGNKSGTDQERLSDNKIATSILNIPLHESAGKTADISENETTTKTVDISEKQTADISEDDTAAKTIDSSENKTAATIEDISDNETAAKNKTAENKDISENDAAKQIDDSVNETAAKTIDSSESNTAAIIADSSENEIPESSESEPAAKTVDVSQNETVAKSSDSSKNETAAKTVDSSENKTAAKTTDISKTLNIDDCKANNDKASEPMIGISSNESATNKSEKAKTSEKITPETKNIDADTPIVDIPKDKSEEEDSCYIVETIQTPIEIMDVDDAETTASPENKIVESELKEQKQESEIIDLDKDTDQKQTMKPEPGAKPSKRTIHGLSNTLDILSDDDDDDTSKSKSKSIDPFDALLQSNNENSNDKNESSQKDDKKQDGDNKKEMSKQDDKCISLDDDDDVMLIDEDSQDDKTEVDGKVDSPAKKKDEAQAVKVEEKMDAKEDLPESPKAVEKATEPQQSVATNTRTEENPAVPEKPRTLIPDDFLKTSKKSIADMSREDLEEFCLEKIAEAVIERNNLGEIKTKLKKMLSNVEEWKNKSLILTKQNRDLQIVLKAIEEEMKKRTNAPIKPLKISRSVGMQVLITETDKVQKKRQPPQPKPNPATTNAAPKQNKQVNNQAIPVPILVPANARSPAKPVQTVQTRQTPNVVRIAANTANTKSPVNKPAEKRPLSVDKDTNCVDLTDDEPPAKQQVTVKNSVQAPVRVVAPHQLMVQRPALHATMPGPRKVFIPINSNGPRPGQLMRGVAVSNNMARPRTGTSVVRVNNVATKTLTQIRHPAPLPSIARQPTHPGWKAVPPAPDLKISKVENGIVISWKIEGYQEDSYEEIASYQLFAYQETQSPPSTMLWKKIGDVKALPLPMACTLTQFMAGYKYYFAVRAVDVRKRIGAFSLPGSILLLTGP